MEGLGHVQVFRFMLSTYARLGITRQEMLCIIHLASYHYNSATGKSKPSRRSIADEMGYGSEARISELTKSLEKKGMLEITRRSGARSIYDGSPFAKRAFALWKKDPYGKADPSVKPDGTPTEKRTGPLRKSVHEEEEKKKKEEEAPPSFQEDFHIQVYFKDKSVDSMGKVTSPPWSVECQECGSAVRINALDTEKECFACGIHSYSLTKHRPKAKVTVHPAVLAYRKKAGKTPNPEQIALIEQTVTDVQFWTEVVSGYLAAGWYAGSVDTMLEYYDRREIPKRGGKKKEPKKSPIVKEGNVHIIKTG